jgi:hypothetical protein
MVSAWNATITAMITRISPKPPSSLTSRKYVGRDGRPLGGRWPLPVNLDRLGACG